VLVLCSLLGVVTFGEAGLLVLSWCCFDSYFKESITIAGLFFFVVLLSFLVVCIRNAARQYVVSEAGCVIGISTILICSLSKKITRL
jgi:hypothetical protein